MTKKRIRTIILCLMIFALLPMQAFAIDRIDLSKDVKLTVHFTHEGQPLPGAEIQLYKVADISDRGEFIVNETFSAYPLQFNELEGNDWAAIANTMNAYAQKDQIEPTDVGITDENGTVMFPKMRKPMEPGFYLITGKTLTYNDMCYTPVPTLIALPNREGDSHHWDYDVETNLKYTFRTAPIDCTVVKAWEDDGNEKERPSSVTIYLMKDGEKVDTVKLSAENGWAHTWTGLDRENSWTVAEETVEGYKVSITQDMTSFTVTNTYTEEEEELPQTGSLWWPVPMLIIAGLICLIFGVLKMKRESDEA